jgi:hypothetical protein
MKRTLGIRIGIGILMTTLTACTLGVGEPNRYNEAPVDTEGGANANDRTPLGGSGDPLLTGVMEIAPSGKYAIMQRNTVTVLLDVEAQTWIELPTQIARVVISKVADVAYAIYADGSLVALDLPSKGVELWHAPAPFTDVSLLRVADNGASLLVVNASEAISIDPATGLTRGVVTLDSSASYGAFLPSGDKAIVVGHTVFTDHKPATPVALVDLMNATVSKTSVPNCEAPVSVLPDGSRALLSPTFCEEDRPVGTPKDAWTNPDPVSVIDITDEGLSFVKNLPGFGPVALSPDGERAVAYLDMARIDRSMFTDKSQIPSDNGAQYHLLVIEPKSLAFDLHPIGDGLPRFAMGRDGLGLLVDASVQVITRASLGAQAGANVTFGADGVSGDAQVSTNIFGMEAAFGYFDLLAGKFTAFSGSKAGIDRFVQLSDNRTVITLEKRADGLGGIPYRIDTWTKSVTPLFGDYGTGVRDIGLLPDGETIILRFRQRAVQIGLDLHGRESFCYSFDAVVCGAGRVEYQSTVPFATLPPPPPPPPPNTPAPPVPPPPMDEMCPGETDCW